MAGPVLALASPFIALCALACPVGMGAMMWFMARGSRSGETPAERPPANVEDLRREHERLGSQIESLEHASPDGQRADPSEHAVHGRRVGVSVPDRPDTLSG